jgi:hypothetical protein
VTIVALAQLGGGIDGNQSHLSHQTSYSLAIDLMALTGVTIGLFFALNLLSSFWGSSYHVADSYVALFSHFIPCGTWEAVYIIDGLLKNTSDIQPDTLHSKWFGFGGQATALPTAASPN